MAGKITKTRKSAKGGSPAGRHHNTKTKTPVKKIAKDDNREIEVILAKRRRLMWLGVGISAAVILLLWFFYWQFWQLTKPAQKAQTNSDFGNLINELTNTISDAKDSLNNINQMIDQQSAQDGQAERQQGDAVIDDLKKEVSEQIEKQNEPEVATEDGEQILIFK